MAVAETIEVRDKLFIGGEWVDPVGKGTIEVINPTTEEVVGSIPEGTSADVEKAAQAARTAFEAFRQTTAEERAEMLGAIAAKLGQRAGEIAALGSAELGMPLSVSRIFQAGAPAFNFGSMPPLMEEIVWQGASGHRDDESRAQDA